MHMHARLGRAKDLLLLDRAQGHGLSPIPSPREGETVNWIARYLCRWEQYEGTGTTVHPIRGNCRMTWSVDGPVDGEAGRFADHPQEPAIETKAVPKPPGPYLIAALFQAGCYPNIPEGRQFSPFQE